LKKKEIDKLPADKHRAKTKPQAPTFATTQPQPPSMPHFLLSNDFPLSLKEFVMRESIPLSEIHHMVLTYLRGRTDVAVFGAQAVNAYVDEFRMTQDVDLMALHAEALATAIRDHLHQELKIATCAGSVASGKGFRVYQVQKPTNRHLVALRQVDKFPSCQLNEY